MSKVGKWPTLEDVYVMRQMYVDGVACGEIARRFGVTERYVFDISKRSEYIVRVELPPLKRSVKKKQHAAFEASTARNIYLRHKRDGESQKQLAHEYGVTVTTINNICNGTSYKFIDRSIP